MNRSVLIVGVSLLATAPLAAQSASSAAQTSTGAASSATPNVTAGATISDTSGAPVGTVTAVANGNATIDTGSVKVAVPVTSIAQRPNGLVMAMTKAQLEAAAQAASKPVEIAVGNQVVGPQGNPVGSVTETNGDLVTVQMPSGKVQLPAKSFAQKAAGTLVIGMTPEQLEAAAKAASGNAPS